MKIFVQQTQNDQEHDSFLLNPHCSLSGPHSAHKISARFSNFISLQNLKVYLSLVEFETRCPLVRREVIVPSQDPGQDLGQDQSHPKDHDLVPSHLEDPAPDQEAVVQEPAQLERFQPRER